MDAEQINALAQLVIQGMVSAVFIWAWSQERKERQERESKHAEERNSWLKEYTSLAREAYQLRPNAMDTTEVASVNHSARSA